MFKKVYVEITNNCNLDCYFCIKNKRNKKYISIDEFKVLLDKLEGYTNYLYFHVMGEPLMHPGINELIDLASTRYRVNITTNGYLINKIKNNKGIRQINISLHSYDTKYKKSLDNYLNNIFDSVDSLVNNGTVINYRLWVNSVNKYEIINKLNDKYNCNIENNKKLKLANNIYYEAEEEFVWPSMNNDYYSENGTCMGTRSHIGILVDGTVVPCCLDSEGIINLGNIYKSNLDDIINSAKFKAIKEGFLNNKKMEMLCKKCCFYDSRR